MPDAYILGIESSCDETAAAVVRSGEYVESNVVSSQIATHQPYGGVVPELASREHLRGILPVVRQALAEAHRTYDDIDAIAVTQGPGLAGALLVGVTYAKALAWGLGKPLIAVNHLEGHIHAVLLEEKQKGNRELRFPVLALVVSGGHTHLYLVQQDTTEGGSATWSYKNAGQTRDDAAGEAFDKVAKLLALGYPGGPIIEKLAAHGNARAVEFARARMKARGKVRGKKPRGAEPEEGPARFDFSFSGIKTAVLREVERRGMKTAIEARRATLAQAPTTVDQILAACDRETLDLAASFQRSVVDDLVSKTLAAARALEAETLFVTGGVAANGALRAEFERQAGPEGLAVYFPSRQLSTDNAAMIAAAAYPKLLARDFAAPEFSAEASLALR
ncbi:MAG: tRNA (adenosine(37)-N6)-threonylcarbamoyltransferase complex transferase subunit TsaD [Acidobacteriota bacterium]|nr:tRNA (adenosine(37)-N6)-threonylcarbamoyltransferase complex transferase subunit TsaD [Acidobacteriota bacterium]